MAKPFIPHAYSVPSRCFFALLTALPLLAQADDYRFDVRGGYTHVSADTFDQDTTHGAATVYLSPVDDTGHPLAEAAFMGRASGLTIRHNRTDFSPNSQALSDMSNEQTYTGATLNYYLPSSPIFLSLTANRATFKEPDSSSMSDTRWSGAVGVTPVEGLLVTSHFYDGQDISNNWNLSARYVMDSRQFEAMAFEADYRYSYGIQSGRWSLDTYLDRTLSLGIGYQRAINTTDDGTLSLRARKFFTDRFSLSASFSHHKRADLFGLEAGLRF